MNYVYNLKRISKTKVRKQYAFPIFFAYNIENKIHRMYAHKRIKDVSRTKYKFWDRYSKIGVSNNVKRRVNEINKSKLKSGKTESFDLNVIDRAIIFIILSFYCLLPWFGLISLSVIIYLLNF